jgi:hypothetical protein
MVAPKKAAPAPKKETEGDDLRQTMTDAVVTSRFTAPKTEPTQVTVTKTQQVLSSEEVWLAGLTTAMRNLEVKTGERVFHAALVADVVLDTFNKKFRKG